MLSRTSVVHPASPSSYEVVGQYVGEPGLLKQDVLIPIFDADHHVFVVAVEGPPTKDNIERALELLDPLSRTWRDIRAIAFAGSEIPRPDVREALAKLSVTVISDQPAKQAVVKAMAYRNDFLSRRQPEAAQATQHGLVA